MAFFTGRTGALYLYAAGSGDPTNLPDSVKALKLRDWSLETSLELLETTTVDTAVKSYTAGSVSATGSATLLYYRTEGEAGVQFTEFLNKIMKTSATGVTDSDRVSITLRAGTTGGPADLDDITFNAFITNASIQVSTGELSTVGIQFTVDGPFREVAG